MKKLQLIGQRFGRLLVIDKAPSKDGKNSYWVCKCDCGNITTIRGSHLTSGQLSCGCLIKETASRISKEYASKRIKDLTGQRFGKLTVISPTNRREEESVVWLCKCDCGNEKEVSSRNLISGKVKSCGCMRSYKEILIKNFLDRNNINYKKEYTFSDLRGKYFPLRFDFGILNEDNKLLCLIEYQGIQHYDENSNWHTETLVDSDNRKKRYCKEKNIPLYELNNTDNLETRLTGILNNYGYQLRTDN